MKFDVDLSTGTVKAEFTLAEAQEILAALKAQHEAKSTPPVLTGLASVNDWWMKVKSESIIGASYQTHIWFDEEGRQHYSCECPDHTCRHGRWCKHLDTSDMARLAEVARQHRVAQLS